MILATSKHYANLYSLAIGTPLARQSTNQTGKR